jgi:hypothetical protein
MAPAAAAGAAAAAAAVAAADLPYFLGLGVLTVYIGAHRGLTSKSRQQLTVKEVRRVCVCVRACVRARVRAEHLPLRLASSFMKQDIANIGCITNVQNA